MKLYISGPMTGLPEFNYPAFREADSLLRNVGYDILNPADSEERNPTPGVPQAWDWYMRHALRMVLDAEGVALLPGWHESRGAALEVHIACALRLPVATVEEWLTREVAW
ncbi:MAG TPA: DUF4406 domain-containing protein [Nocardioidaceae bacterium]|nr:DUF4406 domain-containing protein [Nocardioidaceae bacterium]